MDNNVGSNGNGGSGYRFRRIPRHSLPHFKLDSLLDENLDHLPHLSELVQCYRSDWIKDDNKYGHYESISPVSFQNQIFEGPDTDIETEMQLASARQIKAEDATDDDIPSSSGRQFTNSNVTKHFGQSPLPAYEPAFDWRNERSMIFGQRIPETPTTQYGRRIWGSNNLQHR